MNYIGIDPGQDGAVAMLDSDGRKVAMADFEAFRHQLVMEGVHAGQAHFAVLEQVHAMPKQGVSSTFKFGVNVGWWKGMLEALGIPYIEITPCRWQKAVLDSASIGKEKGSLDFARRRWPEADLHLKKHHGRADALCLAEYGRLTQRPR